MLMSEQEDLLAAIVEASLTVPSDERTGYFCDRGMTGGAVLVGDGLDTVNAINPNFNDVIILIDSGYLRATHRDGSSIEFFVHPRGFGWYEERKQSDPIASVEHEMQSMVGGEEFKARYPEAARLWAEAAALLWSAEQTAHVQTMIGHNAREAMQNFATNLVEIHQPPAVTPNPASIVARLRSVLGTVSDQLGQTEAALLDALLPYWGTVSDLVQRQEHGSQREGDALGWEDGRRIVFQTLNVMFEIENALKRFR
jgi:hypothetical protein